MVMVLVGFVVMIDMPSMPVKINYKLPQFLGGYEIKYDRIIGGYDLYALNGKIQRDLSVRKGLDIAGGVSVLLDADMSNVSGSDRSDALNSLSDSIRDYLDYAVEHGALDEIIDPEEDRFWEAFRKSELQDELLNIKENIDILKTKKIKEVTYA